MDRYETTEQMMQRIASRPDRLRRARQAVRLGRDEIICKAAAAGLTVQELSKLLNMRVTTLLAIIKSNGR